MNQLLPDFNTSRGLAYIVELSQPFERLAFQFVPDTLIKERRGKLAPIEVVNRNNDQHQLTGGSDTLSFQLDFYAASEDRDDVMKRVRWLESLTYRPQRNVKVVLGEMWEDDVWIVDSVSSKITNLRGDRNFKPMQAIVDIVLRLDPVENQTIENLRAR